MIYANGTMDGVIGRLSDDEIAFLKRGNAEVVAVEGGHLSMVLDPGATARIVELLSK